MKSKKAMVGNLVGLAIGITVLAVIATIGMVVLANFASSQAACGKGLNTEATTFNQVTGTCDNITGNAVGGTGGRATESAFYAVQKMGSSSGGLLTWLPVIIPAVIGIGIIGYFMTIRGKGQAY